MNSTMKLSDEIPLDRSCWHEVDEALSKEWIITNGLGGFASSTISGANTRRYHGLLVAALNPPTNRMVILSKLEEELFVSEKRFELGTNEFTDQTIAPRGFYYLVKFKQSSESVIWRYFCDGALLEKKLSIVTGENKIQISYSLISSPKDVILKLHPLCCLRDFHAHQNFQSESEALERFVIIPENNGFYFKIDKSNFQFSISSDLGKYSVDSSVYWNFFHRVEAQRGLDSKEDLFHCGYFEVALKEGESTTLTAMVEDLTVKDLKNKKSLQHKKSKAKKSSAINPILLRAAKQFIVRRGEGSSIIAGYPWFEDWSRDTFISLPGILLATEQFDIAREIFFTYAKELKNGLLPNRFGEGEQKEYNSVDASLLYLAALQKYFDLTKDLSTIKALFPVYEEIITSHLAGTDYNIKVDPTDGLLYAGIDGMQLTWMDAKIGDWIVTPRRGKAVEINALWFAALQSCVNFSKALKKPKFTKVCEAEIKKVKASFIKRFWCEREGCLYDLVDSEDASLEQQEEDFLFRPNQIFALLAPQALISEAQAKSILFYIESNLLTPYGLRTLDPRSSKYRSEYKGDPFSRDSSYHQGTVWPWLLGLFVEAHYQIYQDREKAVNYLQPLKSHLNEGCIGSISEVFSAEPPYAAGGCFAQAWSVGTLLWAEKIIS
jgi:predicted glycogen debranching enzyme